MCLGGYVKFKDSIKITLFYLSYQPIYYFSVNYSKLMARFVFFIFGFFLILNYQNCGQNLKICNPPESSGATSSSSSSSGGSSENKTYLSSECATDNASTNQTSPTNGSSSSAQSSSSGTSTSSGSSSGSGSSGSSSGIIIGTSSSGGGSGSSSSSTSGSSTGSSGGITTYKPLVVNITSSSNIFSEGLHVLLYSTVTGGLPPYKFQWFFNGVADSSENGKKQNFEKINIHNPYSQIGTYRLDVVDAKGTKKSVTFEGKKGCAEGLYVGSNYGYFIELTNNDTKEVNNFNPFQNESGKFLIFGAKNNDNINTINNFISAVFKYPSQYKSKLGGDSIPQINYGDEVLFTENPSDPKNSKPGCRSYLPGVHTPQKNPEPACSDEYGHCSDQDFQGEHYANTAKWKYVGHIKMVCENNKLRLIENTCQWIAVEVPQDEFGAN